jgi:predicted ribosomally synthesized peptide with SipW-like signal peptide
MSSLSKRKPQPKHRQSRSAQAVTHGFLASAAAIGAGTLTAVALSSGTYALWSDNAVSNANTVTAGSLTLLATENFDDSLWQNRVVGDSIRQSFTVTNTGSVAANLSGSAVTGAPGHEVRLARGTCGAAIAGTAATVAPTALSSLAPSQTAIICVQVSLTAAANAGSQAPFTVTVTADQVQ